MDPTKFVLAVCGGIGALLLGVFVLVNRGTPPPGPPVAAEVVEKAAQAPANDQADKVTKMEEPLPAPVPIAPTPNQGSDPAPRELMRFAYKGDTPGVMTLSEFRKKHRQANESVFMQDQTPVRGVTQCKIPVDGMTIAGVPILDASYTFVDQTLVRIMLTVSAQAGRTVLDAIAEAHGEPSSSDPNGEGVAWDTGASLIHVIANFGQVVIVYADIDGESKLQSRRDAAEDAERKRTAKDL